MTFNEKNQVYDDDLFSKMTDFSMADAVSF